MKIMRRKGQCIRQAVVSVTNPINRIRYRWLIKKKDFRKAFNEFELDGKDICGAQERSSWMHNKELHDHGELDDVDPDDDSRFDIIYRHLDPNLGIEKGNSHWRWERRYKNIVSYGTFRPNTKVLWLQWKLIHISFMIPIICLPVSLSIVMKIIQKYLLYPNNL